jgi:hypothetical protein
MTKQIDYETQNGAERARIYRDRLRGVEAEHLGMVADHLAGREVDQDYLKKVTSRLSALKDAIADAEKDEAEAT